MNRATQRSKRWRWFGLVFALGFFALGLGGCASYVTPGGPVNPVSLGDPKIEEAMAREPMAEFPTNIAVVRVQASGYRSHTVESYGRGRYSVVTTREVETEAHFERLAALPQVRGIASLNRLVIPQTLNSDEDLRRAAAALKTDMLLLYTLDTSFRVDTTDLGPLSVVTLGLLPNKQARVTCTASAALYDVRTGFIYGLAEATAKESEIASAWTSRNAIDRSRRDAEREAFDLLVGEFEKAWDGIVQEYATKAVVSVWR